MDLKATFLRWKSTPSYKNYLLDYKSYYLDVEPLSKTSYFELEQF